MTSPTSDQGPGFAAQNMDTVGGFVPPVSSPCSPARAKGASFNTPNPPSLSAITSPKVQMTDPPQSEVRSPSHLKASAPTTENGGQDSRRNSVEQLTRGGSGWYGWKSTATRRRSNQNLYHRIEIAEDDGGVEMSLACDHLVRALECRDKYQARMIDHHIPLPELPDTITYHMEEGVVVCSAQNVFPVPYREYVDDITDVYATVENGPCKSTCRNRLKILDEKYKMYVALNSDLEESVCPFRKGGGVFAKCTKVDNSVRLATAMHPTSLLDYIVECHRNRPNTEVGKTKEGKPVTLAEVLRKYDITDPEALTVEGIGLHPPALKRFHRFDIFSEKYNRGGKKSAELLKLFLKRDGPFYADIVRPVLDVQEKEFPKHRIATEYKLPVFGLSYDEWRKLAEWVYKNKLGKKTSNRWIIQIPRIADLRSIYRCKTLQEQLDYLFLPLWDATLYPEQPGNVELARLLREVSAFNVISDEQHRGQDLPTHRPPTMWEWKDNPPDLYFNYYVWANMCSLNHIRQRKGMNTFLFRPNCGEQGKLDQLVCGYLLAHAINHGIKMERSPVLQYLYYLSQVGIVLSPLANNGLGNPAYIENPFVGFQRRGMKVSLGTDDPLHYHHSNRPLIEEYGTAQKVYRLGPVDLTEIARNSVLISGFEDSVKKEWLGPDYELGVNGNDATKSFVPNIRLLFRDDTLYHEQTILNNALAQIQSNRSVKVKPLAPVLRPGVDSANKYYNLGMLETRINFPRVDIVSPQHDSDPSGPIARAAEQLGECMRLRMWYVRSRNTYEMISAWLKDELSEMENEFKEVSDEWECWPLRGVYRFRKKTPNNNGEWLPRNLADIEQFHRDYNKVHDAVDDLHVKTLSYKRLQVLEYKFNLHMALNHLTENQSSSTHGPKNDNSRDFYQAPKVDTHIHAAAGMTARQLLDFIVDKAANSLDDIVKLDANKQPVTLRQLLYRMNISAEKLTVDHLNVQADSTLFERFDNFNDKYNPMGNADLRTLLLKTDNYMGGRYFAEIAKSTFAQFQRDRYTFAEMRLSIYGRSRDEWTRLSMWFDTHGMASNHNKWMVQVPRIYPIFRKHGYVQSFMDLINNVFQPLWEVSLKPSSNPKLHHFLKHMSGFDSVDNENVVDKAFPLTNPDEWTSQDNPPYGYWMYFMWANIRSLNEFRSQRGMSTFDFRPHCGESGSADHLIYCYLTADCINHGVNLRLDPVLEYIYYLSQVGIAVSPLSNNALFLDILDNPFPTFFRRGLHVSLSTDDPLQFHHTQEPLIEEYSIASKVWKLGPNDMCEIARNSVIHSGFDWKWKSQMIGKWFFLSSSLGNESEKTHLSDIRVTYRFEVYHSEINYLEHLSGDGSFEGLRAMFTPEQEQELIELSLSSIRNQEEERKRKEEEEAASHAAVAQRHDELVKENSSLREELTQLRKALESYAAYSANPSSSQATPQPSPPSSKTPASNLNGKVAPFHPLSDHSEYSHQYPNYPAPPPPPPPTDGKGEHVPRVRNAHSAPSRAARDAAAWADSATRTPFEASRAATAKPSSASAARPRTVPLGRMLNLDNGWAAGQVKTARTTQEGDLNLPPAPTFHTTTK